MNDIKVPPFTEGQKELIEATEKLWCLRFRKSAYEKKFCDVDDVDDDIKDIKEIISETIAKIENQKQTNFQRITASPEKLAEFIYCLIDACDFAAGNGAKKISQYANEDANNKRHIELVHGNLDFGELLEWLNEEDKE